MSKLQVQRQLGSAEPLGERRNGAAAYTALSAARSNAGKALADSRPASARRPERSITQRTWHVVPAGPGGGNQLPSISASTRLR